MCKCQFKISDIWTQELSATYLQDDGGDGGGDGGAGHPEEIQRHRCDLDAEFCSVTGSGWGLLPPDCRSHSRAIVYRFCVSGAGTYSLGSPSCAVSSAFPLPQWMAFCRSRSVTCREKK